MNINIGRLVFFYMIGLIPSMLAIFFVLMVTAFVPAIREVTQTDTSTPGVGLFFIFYIAFSCIGGFVAALPVALALDRFVGNGNKPQKPFYEKFLN